MSGWTTYYADSSSTSTSDTTFYYGGNSTDGGTACGPCTTTATDTVYWSPAYVYCNDVQSVPQETPVQKRTRLEREESVRKEQAELRKEQEAAVKKAEELLKDHIGLEAFGQLHEVGYLELDSQKHKGRKYRIPKEHMEMIEVLDKDGKVIDQLCIHPAVECPPADHILSRVVLLESAEEFVLAKADHHRPY